MAGLFALKMASIFCCCSLWRPIVLTTVLSSHQRPTGPSCKLECVVPVGPREPEAEAGEPPGPPGPPGPLPPGPPGGGPLAGGPPGGPPGGLLCANKLSPATPTRHRNVNTTLRNLDFMASSNPAVSSRDDAAPPKYGMH